MPPLRPVALIVVEWWQSRACIHALLMALTDRLHNQTVSVACFIRHFGVLASLGQPMRVDAVVRANAIADQDIDK
jgi:hypothetical protein